MGSSSSRARKTSDDADSSSSRARTTNRSNAEDGSSPGPEGGFVSEEHVEAYYGVEYEGYEQLQRLKQKEARFGDRIHDWLDEGMPIEAMGTISAMEQFRERKGTPVPWNAEEQNEASVQRSAEAAADTFAEQFGGGESSGIPADPAARAAVQNDSRLVAS